MAKKWIESDDIKALYIYKFGTDHLPFEFHNIANMIDATDASLKMRIANFKSLDVGGGLGNAAKLTIDVYKKYNNLNESDLRRKAFGK